ncbi:MAG: helix-turn-helix transcriptional regulator [Ruminococcaceae bacterium]|nr:helix-turn-helix transcriptional regulator [Oscillospiraceae bacterium]
MSDLCIDTHAKRHEEAVQKAQNHALSADTLRRLTCFFKVIGDGTRMRILASLTDTELCVCAVAQLLGMELSAVSHQLRVLKQSDLVRARREGKTVYYSLADDHVREIIRMGIDHINEERGNEDA